MNFSLLKPLLQDPNGKTLKSVLSTGNGVNSFTLDPSLEEFILTHPNIKVHGYASGSEIDVFISILRMMSKHSMVADIHRTLLYSGIIMYPADIKSPNGKLRILFEVIPKSYLMEQAGDQAFTGKQRVCLSFSFHLIVYYCKDSS
ncbi:hypothetical protein VNO80_28407 [Phaseolus coccineus]|uniref:Fructose-1-6-bisphosphatase class 1 C-terminal domain-containing protein n=1 Tax=Phaseolus coccineus TaxID=3886 RepID=A0AAN9QBD7_PHACN